MTPSRDAWTLRAQLRTDHSVWTSLAGWSKRKLRRPCVPCSVHSGAVSSARVDTYRAPRGRVRLPLLRRWVNRTMIAGTTRASYSAQSACDDICGVHRLVRL